MDPAGAGYYLQVPMGPPPAGMVPGGYVGPPMQAYGPGNYGAQAPVRLARFPAEALHAPVRGMPTSQQQQQFITPPGMAVAPRPTMQLPQQPLRRTGSAGTMPYGPYQQMSPGNMPLPPYAAMVGPPPQYSLQQPGGRVVAPMGGPQPMHPGAGPYAWAQQHPGFNSGPPPGMMLPPGMVGQPPSGMATPKSMAGSGAATPAHPMQRQQTFTPQQQQQGAAAPYYYQQQPSTVAPPPGVMLPESLSPGSPGALGPAATAYQQYAPAGPSSRAHSAGTHPHGGQPQLHARSYSAGGGGLMTPLESMSPTRLAAGGGGPLFARSASGGLASGASSLRSSVDLGSAGSPPRRGSGAPRGGGTPSRPGGAPDAASAPASRAGSASRRPGSMSAAAAAAKFASGSAAEVDAFDNIKVAVRVRPPSAAELARGDTQALFINPSDFQQLQLALPATRGNPAVTRPFTFHACLGPENRQPDVMRLCGIPQMLDAAMDGFNATVMAYGQTGSGKTYTMAGREESLLEGEGGWDAVDGDDGVIARSVAYLFERVEARTASDGCAYQLSASFCEIYNEQLYDLLAGDRRQLQVRWDSVRGFHVPELQCREASDVGEVLGLMTAGVRNRRVGSHELNMESSRSHAIFTLYVHCTPTRPDDHEYGVTRHGKISFVDLAGSERLRDSKSSGETMRETTNINRSLFMLGKVIAALADGAQGARVPYRESKLTKLLQDSLGGSALCLLIACCSPSAAAAEETLSTLSYAARAKNIRNRPTLQVDPDQAALAALRREVKLLRAENGYLREQLLQASLPRGLPAPTPGQPGAPGASAAGSDATPGAAEAQARRAGGSRLPSSGAGMGGATPPSSEDLMRRLLDTQRLLVAVSRENDRLAGVNQRLTQGRQLVADDYKGALEEVDWLRSKLEALEQALLGGSAGGLLAAMAGGRPDAAADGSATPDAAVLEAARAAVADAAEVDALLALAGPPADGVTSMASSSGDASHGGQTGAAIEPLASQLAMAVRSASMAVEAALPSGEVAAAALAAAPLPALGKRPPQHLIEDYLVASPSEMLQQAAGRAAAPGPLGPGAGHGAAGSAGKEALPPTAEEAEGAEAVAEPVTAEQAAPVVVAAAQELHQTAPVVATESEHATSAETETGLAAEQLELAAAVGLMPLAGAPHQEGSNSAAAASAGQPKAGIEVDVAQPGDPAVDASVIANVTVLWPGSGGSAKGAGEVAAAPAADAVA